MKRHALSAGEYLAIKPDAIQRDEAGMFFMIGPDAPDNERHGTVCVVNVRGALSQFKNDCGDSYEGIVERVTLGLEADPKPSALVFRVHSPGGVVAGLNEMVFRLQRMSADSGVPFIAFVDEYAASAAYALCCACEEVLAPPSAIVGSVGTISTMVSLAKQDEAKGVEVVLITSGKRKADGHLHAPITQDAVKAETRRNTQLAAQFFALAGAARGLAPAKLDGLQASIYLANDARRVGLVDDVLSFEDVILGLDATDTGATKAAPNEGNVTDRRAKELAQLDTPPTDESALAHRGTTGEAPMAVKLAALIKTTEAAIASEKDPRKLAALQSKLLAFTATRAEMDGDDKGDKDDAKAAEAAKKAAKKAEAAKHKAKAAEYKQKMAECEEAAKAAEEDDDEESSEEEATTSLSAGAAAALASQADLGREALARIEKLEKSAIAREQAAMIDEAFAKRRVTKAEATTLRGKSPAFVKDFLEMRPKALIATADDMLEQPDMSPSADVPPAVKALVEQAVAAAGLDGKAADELRTKSYDAHRAALAKSNGVGAY